MASNLRKSFSLTKKLQMRALWNGARITSLLQYGVIWFNPSCTGNHLSLLTYNVLPYILFVSVLQGSVEMHVPIYH